MTPKALRVLLLGDARSIHVQRLVDEYQRRDLEVGWLSLEEGDERGQRLPRRGIIRPLNYILSAVDVRREIDRFRPHVINAHFATAYGFVAATATRHTEVPIVLHIWGSDILVGPRRSNFTRRKAEAALRRANIVIGDSNCLIDAAASLSDMQRTEVIPWGMERRYFDLFAVDKNLSKPLKIIMPRPHESVYNTSFAIHGLEELLADGSVQLTVPAWGALRDRFEARAANLPDGAVRYYDRLDRDDYMKMLAEQDIFLSCALSDSSPASLIEAMAVGLIPIVGDIPGVRELVDGSSGYLFDLQQPSELTQVCQRVLGGADDLLEMRSCNHQRMSNEAVFEDNIDRTIALMREVAGHDG